MIPFLRLLGFSYTMTDDDSGGHFLLFILVSIFTLNFTDLRSVLF